RSSRVATAHGGSSRSSEAFPLVRPRGSRVARNRVRASRLLSCLRSLLPMRLVCARKSTIGEGPIPRSQSSSMTTLDRSMVPRPSIGRTAAACQTSGVRMQVGRAVALVFAGSVYQSAISGSVLYQWEDERGQVHYSDTVPDKYKRTARRIDTRTSDVPPEQVRAAQAQADALKARAAATASSGPSSRQLRTSVAGTPAAAGRPSPNLGDCAAWRS